MTGRHWRTRCRAPLFVNVLPTPGGVLAIPVDQGGGLRTGERHLQRIRLDREAEATWAPPATTLCLPGSGSGPAYLQLVASVRGGSYLRVVGRPLIPFRGAEARSPGRLRAGGIHRLLILRRHAGHRPPHVHREADVQRQVAELARQ